ncbi:hypothetical protein DXG01_014260, partial [Tephrocybe rancida]
LGCFPSVPLKPTVAVDMKVLEFVSTLFLNVAPNNTAWCSAVETFLTSHQYKSNTKIALSDFQTLNNQESLRKCFGNALQWYNALQDATTVYVNSILQASWCKELGLDDGIEVDDDLDFMPSSPSLPLPHTVDNPPHSTTPTP